MTQKALVYGSGVAGLATLRALSSRGYGTVVVDDVVTPEKSRVVAAAGGELIPAPSDSGLKSLLVTCDFVAPSPGIPETHRVVSFAREQGIPLRSELDLAYEWESARSGGMRPMLAVTGTDGKTTTVLMAEAILKSAQRRPIACGNTEVPFVEALDLDVDSFVIEATSFRLAFVETFRSDGSAWLNLAPDHLDWHHSMDTYESAKARIWRHVRPSDVAIGFAEDPVVDRHLRSLDCRQLTVGGDTGDFRVRDGMLSSPTTPILAVSEMYRSLPHDVVNALTASALTLETGLADVAAVGTALRDFTGPRHRIEFVAESRGIRYFDDSKATTPHAALTAMRGFDSIVLIAGGRNKDLDLSTMSSESARLRGAVLVGEACEELSRSFHGKCPVDVADSMSDAVEKATRRAQPGDVVLLSPGCTSLDWYGGYAERGDDFVRCVRDLVAKTTDSMMEAAP